MKTYCMESSPDFSGNRQVEESIHCNFCKCIISPAFDNKGKIAFANFDTWQDENKNPVQICMDCSKKAWKKLLSDIPIRGKINLYLTYGKEEKYVSNWIGSLKIYLHRIKASPHNIAGTRRDFWFNIDGSKFHGVQYGEFSQIAHCTRTKS